MEHFSLRTPYFMWNNFVHVNNIYMEYLSISYLVSFYKFAIQHKIEYNKY